MRATFFLPPPAPAARRRKKPFCQTLSDKTTKNGRREGRPKGEKNRGGDAGRKGDARTAVLAYQVTWYGGPISTNRDRVPSCNLLALSCASQRETNAPLGTKRMTKAPGHWARQSASNRAKSVSKD